MGFKIRKSILAGTSGHKKASTNQIKLNKSMDSSSIPDGRAKSSAFQLTDKEKIKWNKEKKTSTNVTETPESTNTTTNFETTGESKGFTPTKTDGEAFRDWLVKNPGGSRAKYNEEANEFRENKKKKHVKSR